MDLGSREEFRVGGNLGMNFQTHHGCPLVFTKEKDIMFKQLLDLSPYINFYEPKPQMLISYLFLTY